MSAPSTPKRSTQTEPKEPYTPAQQRARKHQFDNLDAQQQVLTLAKQIIEITGEITEHSRENGEKAVHYLFDSLKQATVSNGLDRTLLSMPSVYDASDDTKKPAHPDKTADSAHTSGGVEYTGLDEDEAEYTESDEEDDAEYTGSNEDEREKRETAQHTDKRRVTRSGGTYTSTTEGPSSSSKNKGDKTKTQTTDRQEKASLIQPFPFAAHGEQRPADWIKLGVTIVEALTGKTVNPNKAKPMSLAMAREVVHNFLFLSLGTAAADRINEFVAKAHADNSNLSSYAADVLGDPSVLGNGGNVELGLQAVFNGEELDTGNLKTEVFCWGGRYLIMSEPRDATFFVKYCIVIVRFEQSIRKLVNHIKKRDFNDDDDVDETMCELKELNFRTSHGVGVATVVKRYVCHLLGVNEHWLAGFRKGAGTVIELAKKGSSGIFLLMPFTSLASMKKSFRGHIPLILDTLDTHFPEYFQICRFVGNKYVYPVLHAKEDEQVEIPTGKMHDTLSPKTAFLDRVFEQVGREGWPPRVIEAYEDEGEEDNGDEDENVGGQQEGASGAGRSGIFKTSDVA